MNDDDADAIIQELQSVPKFTSEWFELKERERIVQELESVPKFSTEWFELNEDLTELNMQLEVDHSPDGESPPPNNNDADEESPPPLNNGADVESPPPHDDADAASDDDSADESYVEFLDIIQTPSKEEAETANPSPTPSPQDITSAGAVVAPVVTEPVKNEPEITARGSSEDSNEKAANGDEDEEPDKFVLSFMSTILFVIGSVLYLVMAVEDLRWAHTLLTLPVWLRTADDDLAWINYRIEERSSASFIAGAGVRRRGMRRLRLLEKEEDEDQEATTTSAAITSYYYSSEESLARSLQDDPSQYYDECWVDLPQQVQDGYTILGWTEQLWTEGGVAFTDDLNWVELSSEQQAAALSIGYTEEIWCTDEDSGEWVCDPITPMPVTNSPSKRPTDGPTKQPTRKPVTNSPSKKPTSNPVTDSPTTKQPTRKPVTKSPSMEQKPILVTSPHFQWDELNNPDFQKIYEALGYDELLWNSGGKLPLDDLSWDELSFGDRFSISFLGISPESWDALAPGEHFPLQPLPTAKTDTASPTTSNPTRQPSPAPSNAPSPKPSTVAPTTASPTTTSPTTASPTTPPTISPTTASPTVSPAPSVLLNPDDIYGDEWWRHLPQEIQEAFAVLGWSENIWDTGDMPETETPETEEMSWDELSPEQQSAASFIGYTKEMWDVEVEPSIISSTNTTVVNATNATAASPTTAPSVQIIACTLAPVATDNPDVVYGDEWWRDLPQDIQGAFAVLGWNENIWDNPGVGDPSATEEMSWDELTMEQQLAAYTIGYTGELWDIEPCIVSFGNATNAAAINGTTEVPPGTYDDYGWAELPPNVQEAAGVLGYDQKLWEMGGLGWSEAKFWDELPPEAQRAAALLGYDKNSWDNAESAVDAYISYDDDYVFQVDSLDDVWVSRYQILYFFASLSFVFVGAIDLFQERHAFHLLMILAGVFGVVSAVYVEEDIRLSNIYNCVSVHFFLLEALTLFGEHKRRQADVEAGKWLKVTLMFGDLAFILGSLFDVIIFDDTSDWDIDLNIVYVFASVMWLVCSLVYLANDLIWLRSIKTK
ncbi:hypothetical protein ACHAXR_008164 [Thalassiosira sp. AJA248-18]